MDKPVRIFTILSFVLVSLMMLSESANAQNKTLVWERHDVELTINTDGTMDVKETQRIRFLTGTFREGYVYRLKNNTDGMSGFSVYEPDQTYEYWQSKKDHSYRVREDGEKYEVIWNFPKVSRDVRTYVLEYTVEGVVRQYESGDVLNWFAIPEDHAFPINNSTITVTLPEGAEFTEPPVAFSPNTVNWTVSETGRTATFKVNGLISAYDGVAVEVAMTHGVVVAPPPSWQAQADRRAFFEPIMLLIGILGVILGPLSVYWIWLKKGKDPEIGVVPDYITQPPSGLSPGLANTLIAEYVSHAAIKSFLFDFAKRDFIRIVDDANLSKIKSGRPKIYLEKTNSPDVKNSSNYERNLLASIFQSAQIRSLEGALPEKFHKYLPRLRRAIFDDLVAKDYFAEAPDKVRQRYSVSLGALIWVVWLAFFLSSLWLPYVNLYTVSLAIGPILFFIGMQFMAQHMPAKTELGAREAAKWNAFKTYLQNIEQYSDLKHVADKFEEYLPYAVAFGIERRWIHIFSQIPETPTPSWYGRREDRSLKQSHTSAPIETRTQRVQDEAGEWSSSSSLNEMGSEIGSGLNVLGSQMISTLSTIDRTVRTLPASMRSSSSSSSGSSGGSSRSSSSSSSGGGGGGFR